MSPTARGLFAPALVGLHLFAVVAIVFTIVMGLWQLGVYDDRQAEERAEQGDVPVAPLADVLNPDDPFTDSDNFRPVTATGTFGPAEHQFWVSGRERDGEEGYWLVAPFVPADAASASGDLDPALLVVRGWSAGNDAPPSPPSGTVEIEAVLQPTESETAEAAAFDAERTTASIKIPLLANELPYDLYSGFGIATGVDDAADGGLAVAEPPDPDVSWTAGLRNLVYAVQWWVFGAFALYMWVRMTREVLEGRADDDDESDAETPVEDRLDSPVA